jgi:hypothetical protein
LHPAAPGGTRLADKVIPPDIQLKFATSRIYHIPGGDHPSMIAHPEVTVVGLILTTRFRITPRFLRTSCFRESDVFRQLFEGLVAACMAAGLVKGEGFAVDASVMEANASRYHGKAPDEIAWAEPEHQTRAVREYLAELEAENEPNPDRKPPKVISPSDPCSAWTAKSEQTSSIRLWPQLSGGHRERSHCRR